MEPLARRRLLRDRVWWRQVRAEGSARCKTQGGVRQRDDTVPRVASRKGYADAGVGLCRSRARVPASVARPPRSCSRRVAQTHAHLQASAERHHGRRRKGHACCRSRCVVCARVSVGKRGKWRSTGGAALTFWSVLPARRARPHARAGAGAYAPARAHTPAKDRECGHTRRQAWLHAHADGMRTQRGRKDKLAVEGNRHGRHAHLQTGDAASAEARHPDSTVATTTRRGIQGGCERQGAVLLGLGGRRPRSSFL